MVTPLLTVLVAGSAPWAVDAPSRADLARIVVEISRTVDLPSPPSPEAEAPRAVDAQPPAAAPAPAVAAPAVPLLVTYDWRSPVVFDLP